MQTVEGKLMLVSTLSAGSTIWQLVGGLLSAHDKSKADLFNQHVEPLYVRLVAVHQDYLKSFDQLWKLLDSGELTIAEAGLFLTNRRRDFLHERDLATHIADQLIEAERRPVRPDAWNAVLAFCNEINIYLSKPYQFAVGSFFTSVIDATRKEPREALAGTLLFTAEVQDEVELRELSAMVWSILNSRLPNAFSAVSRQYAQCRILLL